jgi:hypothetical protein
MVARSASLAADRNRAVFSLWGWAMLLVIALSAAPTGGALRTQVFGSAFDPATYSVTTAPKRHSLLAEVQTKDEGEPDEAPAADYPVLSDALAVQATAVTPPPVVDSPPFADRAATAHVIADNRAARAPPSK